MSNYTSSELTESAGAVLFHLRKRAICLVYYKKKDEWLLAKGRRAQGESRQAAAIREVTEETGYKCHLLPVTMESRVTPIIETDHTPDIPRVYENCTEPFMCTIRPLHEKGIKLIFWYIAAIDVDEIVGEGEDIFDVSLFGFEEAVEKAKYADDKEIIRRAIDLVKATHGDVGSSEQGLGPTS